MPFLITQYKMLIIQWTGLMCVSGEVIAEESLSSEGESKDAPDEGSSMYRLKGVVVHSGQANGGHYYSFIRSDRGDGKWYKFDDTDVHEHDLSTDDVSSVLYFTAPLCERNQK